MKQLISTALLMMCLLILTTAPSTLFAVDPNQENEAATLSQSPHRMDISPQERSEWMLERVREIDPQKAEELAQLKDKDPNALTTEFHNFMRERMMDRYSQMKQKNGSVGKKPQDKPKLPPDKPLPPPEAPKFDSTGADVFRQHLQQWSDEYFKWLKENYPDEAAKIEQFQKGSPEYNRAMAISGKKYVGIFETSKTNPQIAEVLKNQLKLKEKRADLLRQIKSTADEKNKMKLTAELENIVSQQFDLIIKHKQLVCEDLAKKLKDLNKELDKKKADIEKWKNSDFKNQKVKERVNELLSESEKFEWE